jgi:uncharacterized protein (DUF2062 family)
LRYFTHRLKRLRATPHAIAVGFAAGAAMSFVPVLGVQWVFALGLTWLLRGSMLAAVLGLAVGNPVTYPLMYGAAYGIGLWLLETAEVPTAVEVAAVETGSASQWAAFLPVLRITTVGSLPLAAVAFVLFYVLIRAVAAKVEAARLARRVRAADLI